MVSISRTLCESRFSTCDYGNKVTTNQHTLGVTNRRYWSRSSLLPSSITADGNFQGVLVHLPWHLQWHDVGKPIGLVELLKNVGHFLTLKSGVKNHPLFSSWKNDFSQKMETFLPLNVSIWNFVRTWSCSKPHQFCYTPARHVMWSLDKYQSPWICQGWQNVRWLPQFHEKNHEWLQVYLH